MRANEGCSGWPSRASSHRGRAMSGDGEAFVAFDTSKEKNAVAIAVGDRTGEVRYLGEIGNTPEATRKLVTKLAAKYGRLHFCYEAGPTGYGLHRQIVALGHPCVVVAPSLIPKRPGDRVKTNRRDAVTLAKLLRAGEFDILLTLQERKSRLTLARGLSGKDAGVAAKTTAEELTGLPASARRTITYDNGGEFARHEDVTEKIGLRAYFCDPHSPWQRGGIENANGRLRRDLPRNTNLDGYTDADITDVVWNLNSTPRKCLAYQTPIEVFAANLGVALEL